MRETRRLTTLLLVLIAATFLSTDPAIADEPRMEYITNGVVKVGINRDWGGGIGYFSRVGADQLNVINHYDRGRNIQQSFYGSENSSVYDNWRFNPVQGGDAWGNFSAITRKDNYGDAIYVRTAPIEWKPYQHLAPRQTPSFMEQWITLRGAVAQIVYRFKYTGNATHVLWDQEMPAPYFIKYLSKLAYFKNGAIRYKTASQIPINNGNGTNGFLTHDEDWAAYLNNQNWGCGVFTPGTNRITYFRSTGAGGPAGFGTSYFAPLRRYSLKPGFDVQYTTYLFIANVGDIRNKFRNIKNNGVRLEYNGGFEQRLGSWPRNWQTASDAGGSHLHHTSGGQWTASGSSSVALTAQSSGGWELPYFVQRQAGVTGSTQYRVKFKARCQNLYNGTAGIRIIQFNRRGRLLSDSGILKASEVSGNHGSFRSKNFTFKTHSAAATIEIRLQLNSRDSWARAWFDDVSFTLANP